MVVFCCVAKVFYVDWLYNCFLWSEMTNQKIVNALSAVKARVVACVYLFVFELVSLSSDVNVFVANRKAASRGGFVSGIVALVLGGYMVGATLPDAITYATNATAWASAPAPVQTLATSLLGIIMIIAVIVMFIRAAGLD